VDPETVRTLWGIHSLIGILLRLAVVALAAFVAYAGLGGREGKHGIAVILGIIFFGWLIIWPAWVARGMKGSHAGFAISSELRAFKAKYDRYPNDLPEFCGKLKELELESCAACKTACYTRRDTYDKPLFYEAKSDGFVLVSHGRDGEPDGTNYWKVRGDLAEDSICGHPDHDVVISDKGPHFICE